MISIRLLTRSDDFTDLIALSREFFKEYETYQKDFFKINELNAQDIIHYFNSFCEQESRMAFIALDGDRIIGYITVYVKEQANYWRFNKIGEISGLMVNMQYRKLGIGKNLLKEAIAFFSAQKLIYFTVYTAVANQAGLDFYQKNGLVPLYTTFIGSTPVTIH